MPPAAKPNSDELLNLAASGDRRATHELFARHRSKLKRMVSFRLNRRMASRVDASDIVQEALHDASQKLEEYLKTRPLPFYPWLRHFAWERLVRAYRRHMVAQRRSVRREETLDVLLSDESAAVLADRFLAADTNPVDRIARSERRRTIHELLAKLPAEDRELLILRFVEQLTMAETAAILGISEAAGKMRQARLLQKLRLNLGDDL
jgi:RNA polymerase sigma-70 factor (ECF subfamily)